MLQNIDKMEFLPFHPPMQYTAPEMYRDTQLGFQAAPTAHGCLFIGEDHPWNHRVAQMNILENDFDAFENYKTHNDHVLSLSATIHTTRISESQSAQATHAMYRGQSLWNLPCLGDAAEGAWKDGLLVLETGRKAPQIHTWREWSLLMSCENLSPQCISLWCVIKEWKDTNCNICRDLKSIPPSLQDCR